MAMEQIPVQPKDAGNEAGLSERHPPLDPVVADRLSSGVIKPARAAAPPISSQAGDVE